MRSLADLERERARMADFRKEAGLDGAMLAKTTATVIGGLGHAAEFAVNTGRGLLNAAKSFGHSPWLEGKIGRTGARAVAATGVLGGGALTASSAPGIVRQIGNTASSIPTG